MGAPVEGEGLSVDPVTLIVAALVAGAASGAGEVATSAIKDAYAGFKNLIKKKFGGNSAGEVVLEKHEKSPEAWEPALREEITAAGLDKDEEVLAAAKALVKDAEAAGIVTKFHNQIAGDVGIIGDHGTIGRFK